MDGLARLRHSVVEVDPAIGRDPADRRSSGLEEDDLRAVGRVRRFVPRTARRDARQHDLARRDTVRVDLPLLLGVDLLIQDEDPLAVGRPRGLDIRGRDVGWDPLARRAIGPVEIQVPVLTTVHDHEARARERVDLGRGRRRRHDRARSGDRRGPRRHDGRLRPDEQPARQRRADDERGDEGGGDEDGPPPRPGLAIDGPQDLDGRIPRPAADLTDIGEGLEHRIEHRSRIDDLVFLEPVQDDAIAWVRHRPEVARPAHRDSSSITGRSCASRAARSARSA